MNLREQCPSLPPQPSEQTGFQQPPLLSVRDNRGCAIEEVALRLGWLCECPYHGEPFRSPAVAPELAGVVRGGGDVMLHDAALLASAYAEFCPLCERENVLPID